MEIQFGPNSVDEPNLLYKLQRKVKVFNTNHLLPNRGYNLVASSSKYGVVFIASPDKTLSVYYLNHLINKECEPQHLSVKLEEVPTHIAVNSDQELLAVTGGKVLSIYPISQFQNQVSPSSTKLDINPSVYVSALQWNPCIADTLAIAYFDGTLLVSQVSSMQIKKVQSKARCMCWSPKGKQLVVGNSDGTLCQYKPDLSPMKSIPAPNLFEGSPIEALAVYWISTYQFAVVYKNASDNSRPAVTVINTPKGGQPSCLNYEDICYSMGSNRPWYYYLQGIPQWNIILSSSSNSMEIATLASKDGASWLQWCQTDEARPELPLTDKKQENYPIGICIDTCAIHQLPWGENETLPHMPSLLVLSQSGLLTIFNIINLNKEAAQICVPPQLLALPSAAMTSVIPDDVPPPQPEETSTVTFTLPQPKPQPAQIIQQTPQVAQVASTPSTNQFSLPTSVAAKPFSAQQPQIGQGFAPPPYTPQVVEQKPQVDIKSTPAAQPQILQAQTKPPPPAPAPSQIPKPQAPEINAALKAEQEKAYKMKVKMELKQMLIKEVNDFQMELYKFRMHAWKTQNQLQRDLHSINPNSNLLSLDAEKLKKDCSLEELREAIVQLKLELVRACAVVAEARTHHEAKDLEQWTQADPLTMKRMACVKKLAYYVEMQLDQAHKSLDYKWNTISNKDPEFNKPGQFIIRPILDDVYQLLVKQQEILSRQQAVLRTLRNTHNECDTAPVFKSSSLLRSTPFKNKDPLSKLTKNILNMSIEPQNKTKEQLLTPQKLDALRDVLSNHRPIKIKPVNGELRQQLAAMRLNYEKRMKEKASSELYSEDKLQQQLQLRQEQNVQIQQQLKLQQQQQHLQLHEQRQLPQLKLQQQHLQFYQQLQSIDQQCSQQLQKKIQLIEQQCMQQIQKQIQLTEQQCSQQIQKQIQWTEQQCLQQLQKQEQQCSQQIQKQIQLTEQQCLQQLQKQEQQCSQQIQKQIQLTEQQCLQQLQKQMPVKIEPTQFVPTKAAVKVEPKTETTKQQPLIVPKFTPLAHVARTLFTDEPEQATKPPQVQQPQIQQSLKVQQPQIQQPPTSKVGFTVPTSITASANTRTVLKDLLQNKSQANIVGKNDTSMFMGQKICSPISFTATAATTTPSTSVSTGNDFTSKPIADINNMFNKFQPQTFVPESKPTNLGNQKSDETGELETTAQSGKPFDTKKEDKPLTNLFGMKTSTPLSANSQNVPDVLKSSSQTGFRNIENKPTKSLDKESEKSKENVLEKQNGNVSQTVQKGVNNDKKQISVQNENQALRGSNAQPVVTSASSLAPSNDAEKSIEAKNETKHEASKTTEKPDSITANASITVPTTDSRSAPLTSEPASMFGGVVIAQSTATPIATTAEQPVFVKTTSTSSASSIFGTAVASQAALNLSTTTKTTPSGSIFNTTPTSTPSSVFGSTSPGSIFGNAATTQSSVFAATGAQSLSSSTVSTKPSVFISSTPASPSSVFGTAVATSAQTAFGISTSAPASSTATPSSVFGSSSSGSIFGTPTSTPASVFGSGSTSVFAAGAATTQSPMFGSTATTSQSLFCAPTATTQGSIFGGTTTTTQSVFGTTATTQASIFGAPATSQASVFGSTSSSQTSLFGSTPTTQAPVFGSPPTTQASIFSSPTYSTQTSIFGSPTPATQASVFGAPSTQASIFGSPTPSTQASVFGTPPQTTQASVFGSPTTQASVFGSPTVTTTQSGSLFGGAESNLFAAASISTTSAPSQTSGGNIFGGGGGGNVFGGKVTYGQPNPTVDTIFGGEASFGQKQTTSFWGNGNTASGGGFGSGFGQQATTQPSSIFGGGGGGGSFSSPSSAPAFGSPQQNVPFGGGDAKPSVFGSPQQQNAPTFGGSAFGSKPAFGQSASFGSSANFGSFGGFNKSPSAGFGSPATFGGGASFGNTAFGNTSPGKVFGSSSPGFGAPTQSNATFENLATQNTLTFGNLAQNSGQQTQQPPSFNTSPSFSGWRG